MSPRCDIVLSCHMLLMLLMLLILLTLFHLFTFSDQLVFIGKGTYNLQDLFLYLALTTPRMIYELMPSSALLGSLFVVGAMANHREIVAMRAIGLSTLWVIRTIMLAGLVLVVISVLIGEYIAPDSERTAQVLRNTTQNETDGVIMHSQYGMWLREGDRFINVRKILDDGALADVRIYDVNNQNKLQRITHADHARFLGNNHWRLDGVKQSEIGADYEKINALTVDSQTWESSIDADLLKVTVVDSDNLSLYDLYMYIDFLKSNNQKSQIYELAFWSRLINPFVTFVMLMVSAPFVIGIGRGTNTGGRIMLGVVIGMLFNIFDKIAGHMGLVYGLDPTLVAIAPSLLMCLGAMIAIFKVS